MQQRFWSLDSDIIEGPTEAGTKVATAVNADAAKFIVGGLNLIADFSYRCLALNSAIVERIKQDAKWGEQNHDPITWSAILTEECGEFAQAALHCRFGGHAADGLREEAVHCAAVALQIVECIDRNAAAKKEENAEVSDRPS